MMTIARRNGICNLPFTDARQTAWPAYGASLFMHSQIESGSGCPTTMTKASIPLVRLNPSSMRCWGRCCVHRLRRA